MDTKEHASNILLIVLDTLRADRLSCYGYERKTSPFLDTFARENIRFTAAYTTGPWTVPVHGSLFTGKLPSYHGSHRKSKTFKFSDQNSLAGFLSKCGYHTAGFSANPWITPQFEFDNGFDDFAYIRNQPPFPEEEISPDVSIDDIGSVDGVRQILRWSMEGNPVERISNGIWKKFISLPQAEAHQLNEKILNWIDKNDGDHKFIFANFMDVHDPHPDSFFSKFIQKSNHLSTLHRSGTLQSVRRPLIKDWVPFKSEPDNPKRARLLYDQSIQHLDSELQNLFSALRSRINLDDSLIIILGDHGECMGEHGYWGHGTYLYEELLRVPLIIKLPDAVDIDEIHETSPVSLVDLPGFISRMTGLTFPERQSDSENSFFNNLPVFAECTGPRPDMEGIASSKGYRAVIGEKEKFIRNLETNEFKMESTVDSKKEIIDEKLKSNLEELERNCWSKPIFNIKEDCENVSPEIQRNLSDLGYL